MAFSLRAVGQNPKISLSNILDKHFAMIRYAGLFSNRWKKQYLAQARAALSQPESDDCSENKKPLWAQRQSDYPGINPLQCPNCDKPLTFVGCFFGNWNQLQHLFEKAGKDASIAAAYINIYCKKVKIDPNNPDANTEVMRF